VGDRGGLIVVGVDGSGGAAAALDFALSQGWSHGCPVEVVTAWLGGHGNGSPDHDELAERRERVQLMQDQMVAECLEGRAGVPELLRIVVHDYAGRVLVSRAEPASMLVVGRGSPGSASPQVLGSVAEYCLRHSPVPVVIVPEPDRGEHREVARAE
jgi:nucleotide-binding universal stress UspA family protein